VVLRLQQGPGWRLPHAVQALTALTRQPAPGVANPGGTFAREPPDVPLTYRSPARPPGRAGGRGRGAVLERQLPAGDRRDRA
jgi:hypothetical protein